jgi:hypothetical protein
MSCDRCPPPTPPPFSAGRWVLLVKGDDEGKLTKRFNILNDATQRQKYLARLRAELYGVKRLKLLPDQFTLVWEETNEDRRTRGFNGTYPIPPGERPAGWPIRGMGV